jgi:murein DD-endopeptidase MepM/ murein hydrolase activator NlpD
MKIRALVPFLLLFSLNPLPVRAESQWTWPVEGQHIVTNKFDRPTQNWLPGHRGVDLEASTGRVVVAAGAGNIIFAGFIAGKGVITISHGALHTTYEPVLPLVQVGAKVKKGQRIGYLAPGVSHCSLEIAPTCLHWGLKRGTEYLNPLSLVNPRPRLLPLYRN